MPLDQIKEDKWETGRVEKQKAKRELTMTAEKLYIKVGF